MERILHGGICDEGKEFFMEGEPDFLALYEGTPPCTHNK